MNGKDASSDPSEVASPRSRLTSTAASVNTYFTSVRIALLAGLVALGIGCYQLSLPHVLNGVLGYNEGYDDGVYLGVATRLVHGVIPYKDFVFVHPPGIAYLMAPVALIGLATGTHVSLEIARCLTVLFVAANAFLAGLVVRSIGRLAVAFASFFLALWPFTVSVDRTVELEPYLVFFCLLGVVLVFRHGDLAQPRRLIIGGLALGFAFDVKVWAALPILAVLICCVPRVRRGLLPVSAGILTAVVVPCLPFFAAAPYGFLHDVVTAQLYRQGAAVPFAERLLLITGQGGSGAIFSSLGATGRSYPLPYVADALLIALVVLIALVFGLGFRRRTRVEWFALAAPTVVFAGMLLSPSFPDHYSYFPVAFLVLLAGVCIGRSTQELRRLAADSVAVSRFGQIGLALSLAVGLIGVAFATNYEATLARSYLSESSDPSNQLDSVIPVGACVISDFPADLLVANRFSPNQPGCPAVLDPFGLYLADDNGSSPHPDPPYSTKFEAEWMTWLSEANYVELRIPYSDFIPWTASMIKWFGENYVLVAHFHTVYAPGYVDTAKDEYVYRRTG